MLPLAADEVEGGGPMEGLVELAVDQSVLGEAVHPVHPEALPVGHEALRHRPDVGDVRGLASLVSPGAGGGQVAGSPRPGP